MRAWRLLLLAFPLLSIAGCADVLGVEPLSGSDAAAGADAEVSLPLSDAGAVDPTDACTIAWVDASGGAVPAGAVPNPVPGSTASLYVCRVSSPALGVIPGKLLPGWACYYGDGESEILAQNYEVLVPSSHCTVGWGGAALGNLPVGALVCGADEDGGYLYSCRVGTTGADPGELGHVGWSTNHECLYSLSGASLTTTDFDVLTVE